MKEDEDFRSTYTANIIINIFLCFAAIMLNIVTIHAIRNTSSLAKPLKTLLLNLAVYDLSVGLLVHPFYIAILVMHLMGKTDNNIVFENTKIGLSIIVNFLIYASFFGVMALTADRFLAIHMHLRYQELVTPKRVVFVVTTLTVASVFLSSIQVWNSVETVMLATFYIIIDIACLVILAVMYCKIYLTVRRHRNQIESLQIQQNEQNGDMTPLNLARRVKLAVGSFCVYLVFSACHLPNICLQIAITISGRNTTTEHLKVYSGTMILLNSSLNPLIYCWKMRHIRHAVITLLQKHFPYHLLTSSVRPLKGNLRPRP